MRLTKASPRSGVADQRGDLPDLLARILDAVRRVDLDQPVSQEPSAFQRVGRVC